MMIQTNSMQELFSFSTNQFSVFNDISQYDLVQIHPSQIEWILNASLTTLVDQKQLYSAFTFLPQSGFHFLKFS